ncbi:MAG: hypothetical protein NC548_62995 [Lachnospiraceae bacterium]|nr:hypothetical protein [Lachnospiraceae bacterium]MCM1237271.1 hypothetical protein [Ruminococcus flavefaciens]
MKNSQNLAETIEFLSKEKGVSVSSLLQELDMNKNALFTMKKNGYLPRVESLCKFADYFQCSLDYLVGRTDEPHSEKTDPTTQILVEHFGTLSPEDKIAVLNIVLAKSKKQ